MIENNDAIVELATLLVEERRKNDALRDQVALLVEELGPEAAQPYRTREVD